MERTLVGCYEVHGKNGDVTIGQGNNLAGTGTMTVESGGTLNVANILYHRNIANGTSEISGTVNVGSHLWTGWTAGTIGTINVNGGGILNVSGQLSLNWHRMLGSVSPLEMVFI